MVGELIFQNLELISLLYAFSIIFICAFLVLKIDRAFKLSDYQGLRYLRNAFFFYGLAFIFNFIFGRVAVSFQKIYSFSIGILFSFSMMCATLFLFYSLVWKNLETEKSYNSFLNYRSVVIYVIALVVALLNIHVLFLFQVVLYVGIFLLTLKNLISSKSKYSFLRYYPLAILGALISWVLLYLYQVWQLGGFLVLISIIANLAFFLIFLVGIIKVTQNKNG